MLLSQCCGTSKETQIKQVARNTGLELKEKRSGPLEQRCLLPRLGSLRLRNVSGMFQKEGVKEAESPL